MSQFGPDLKQVSKFISYVLRHHPESAGLALDAEGWTPVADLLRALQERGDPASLELLQQLVQDDAKGRYAFSPDGTQIRANQGHSVAVDLGLSPVAPPDLLYHGTVERSLPPILADGLQPMERHHVHLSGDLQTATAVGARRGKPVILLIDAKSMHAAGHLFYRSANGVWLTPAVPPTFLRRH